MNSSFPVAKTQVESKKQARGKMFILLPKSTQACELQYRFLLHHAPPSGSHLIGPKLIQRRDTDPMYTAREYKEDKRNEESNN